MIGLPALYALTGVLFAGVAVMAATTRSNPKRFGNAAFWGLLAVAFLAGDVLPDLASGAIVIALVVLAGTGALGRGTPNTDHAARVAAAERHGNRLFAAALIIPAVVIA